MKFVEIKEGTFVNLDHVSGVVIVEHETGVVIHYFSPTGEKMASVEKQSREDAYHHLRSMGIYTEI